MPRPTSNIKPFAFFFNYEGMNQKDSTFIIQPSSAASIINMHRSSKGSFTAYNQGYSALNSTALESGATIPSLAGFTDASGNKYLLAACNGKLKSLNMATGAVISDVSTGLTVGNQISTAALKGRLYITDGAITPLSWSGTGTASAVSGLPLTNGLEIYNKPKIVSAYTNRLVYANFRGTSSSGVPTTFPAHIAISNDLAPDTFTLTPTSTATNAMVAQISPGDGEEITAVRQLSVPQLSETMLVIFKERSIYTLTGNTPTTFSVQQMSNSYGCLNNNCVVQVGSDLIFADEDGVYSLTTATNSGTIQPKVIGFRKIQTTYATLNTTAKDKAWMVYHKDRNEVWIGIPTGASSEVDTILIYALPNDQDEDHIWTVRNGFPTAPKCGLVFNHKFWTGDSAGQVQTWFSASMYNGSGFNYSLLYPYFNFGPVAGATQDQFKELTSLNAWFLLAGSEQIVFAQNWRGGGNNNRTSLSKTVSTTAGAALYGNVHPPAALYATDYYGSGAQLVMEQLQPRGNGLQLQLGISGTTGTSAPVFLGFSGLVRYGKYSIDYR